MPLSAEEREKLAGFIGSGKRSARLPTKARILLKEDVSEAGEGWSESRIAEALGASVANVEQTRRQLVDEGLEAWAGFVEPERAREPDAALRPVNSM